MSISTNPRTTPTPAAARPGHLAAVPSTPPATTRPSIITPWTVEDYAPRLGEVEATYLRDRYVAPLVAVAGGLRTLLPDGVNQFCERSSIEGTRTYGPKATVVRSTGPGSSMVVPHHPIDQVVTYGMDAESDPDARVLFPATTYQFRPCEPLPDGKGGLRKFLNLPGMGCVLGAHPSMPASYRDAPAVLVAEGVAKGYAMLTSYLIERALVREDDGSRRALVASDLELTDDEKADKGGLQLAARRLRGLMGSVSEDDRVLIITMVGVGTWHNNPEWNVVGRRDRRFYLGVDGDARAKWQVHQQVSKFFDFVEAGKCKSIALVQPSVPGLDAAGMDDAAAVGFGFTEQMDGATTTLPPVPPRPHADGETRVNVETCRTEVWRGGIDPETGDAFGSWEELAPVAVRVAASTAVLMARPAHIATNEPPAAGSYGRDGALEVQWLDDGGERHTGRIIGPESTMYSARPSDWHRQGVEVPSEVLHLDAWPFSQDVVRAAKSSRDEMVEDCSYGHMGYVPDPAAPAPAFILGDDVIAHPDAVGGSLARPGLKSFDPASSYAASPLVGLDGRLDRAAWLAAAREFLDVYDGGVWQRRGHAATAISLAMRPAVPVQSRSVLILAGTTSAGKTFTARTIMASVGTWTKDLPGSANDTTAYTETAVGVTPIWTSDDLAPTSDRVAYARRADAMQDTVRAVRNGTRFRGRSSSSGATQVERHPRAVFILPTENDLDVGSAMNRGLVISVADGFLAADDKPTNRMEKAIKDGLPRRVLSGLVQWTQEQASTVWSWKSVAADVQVAWDGNAMWAATKLEKAGVRKGRTRAAENYADGVAGLSHLRSALDDLGATDLTRRCDALIKAMREFHLEAVTTADTSRPGDQLLGILRELLATGQAHVTDPTGGHPVSVEGSPSADLEVAHRLGWRRGGGGLTPGGSALGVVVTNAAGRQALVLTQLPTMLRLAERGGLLPAGIKARQAAQQLATGPAAATGAEGWTPKPGTVSTFRVKGRTGVPLWLDAVLDTTEATDEVDEDGGDDGELDLPEGRV